MKRLYILYLCAMMLFPNVLWAQEFNIFAKQKVVVADIIDRNDRKLSAAVKRVIRQGIIDACVSSSIYDVYEVNIDDIKKRIVSRGEKSTFQNVCKEIGKRADYIIFTNVKTSTSDLSSQNVKLIISTSLYRIATASEVLADVAFAEPSSVSITATTNDLVRRLLRIDGGERTTQSPVSVTTVSTTLEMSNELIDSFRRLSIPELYSKARELYDNGNSKNAVKYFKYIAEQNHTQAQYDLGFCYANGDGVPKNYKEASKWFHRAAEQGDNKAQYYLGYLYENGMGVTKSSEEAVKWYCIAAENGNQTAIERIVIPTNEIWYTSTTNSPVIPHSESAFGANIISNVYKEGKGVILFDGIVRKIGNYAFCNCTNISNVVIPNGVTSIGHEAFYNCANLTNVVIPNGVDVIESLAFCDCSKLKSVTIPNSITKIRDRAFLSCTNLEAFYGKFASLDHRCLIVNGKLTSFAPAGLSEYKIPYNVTSIDNDAFMRCSSLKKISIPNSVTSIGAWAFYGCSSLTSVTIPNSVTKIGHYAFEKCTSLKKVYCECYSPPQGGTKMFHKNASKRVIEVPRGSICSYIFKRYWMRYIFSYR